MNHCLLEVKVKQAPTVRYTQDNKTPVAEMEVIFDGLRAEDPPSTIKVIGWGNMAQELQNSVQTNQKLVIEGRLRMNTIPRQDGSKEKKAEFTLSKLHFPNQANNETPNQTTNETNDRNKFNRQEERVINSAKQPDSFENNKNSTESVSWDTSPLVPDTDEIPF